MQNLAGHPQSTRLAKSELEEAGIPVVTLDAPYGEVGSWCGGNLHGFTFKRAWCYWVVEGPMPIAQARAMYATPVGARDVRVAGHCGCPPPDGWAEWKAADGKRLYADPTGKREQEWREMVARHPELADEDHLFRHVSDPSKEPGAVAHVTSYHVDSAEGLRLLANCIRSMHDAPALAVA